MDTRLELVDGRGIDENLAAAVGARVFTSLSAPVRQSNGQGRAGRSPACIAAERPVLGRHPAAGGNPTRIRQRTAHNNAGLFALILAASGGAYGPSTALSGGMLLIILAVLTRLRWEIVRASMGAVVALLLLSANCFPWYLSWLVPFLAIYPNAALLLWTALAVLAYHVVIDYAALGIWRESNEFLLLEYVPVYGMLLAGTSAVRSGVLNLPGRLRGLRLGACAAAKRPRELGLVPMPFTWGSRGVVR